MGQFASTECICNNGLLDAQQVMYYLPRINIQVSPGPSTPQPTWLKVTPVWASVTPHWLSLALIIRRSRHVNTITTVDTGEERYIAEYGHVNTVIRHCLRWRWMAGNNRYLPRIRHCRQATATYRPRISLVLLAGPPAIAAWQYWLTPQRHINGQ